jgi:hypothetical protein
VTLGRSAATVTTPSRAARRAASRVFATTAKTGWPWNSTSVAANAGSSPLAGEMSLRPGTSAAVSTATTPGKVRTPARSTPVMRPLATGDPPMATCSVPSGSGMSSM